MSERIANTWGRFCLRYRKTVLAIILGITAVAAVQLQDVRFDNALEIWFLDDDPALLAHRRLIDTFTSDELVVIGFEAPDVFDPEVLALIDRVTRAVEEAPHVEKVFSLTNIESITGRDDMIEVGDLVEFPIDPAELPGLRERTLANDLYVGNVVSADGGFACIIARLPHYTDNFDYKVEAISAIRLILESEPDTHFYFAGGPVFDERFFYLSERDSMVTSGVMIALLVTTLWLLTRSVTGVVLPLTTVVLATIWAIGWIALAGVKVNFVTTMLPPLMLAVGIAGSMHVMVDYGNRLAAGQEKIAALRDVYRELTGPLFLTTLTTAIGMMSLTISRVQGIREFGAFAALGVVGAFLLSITFVPVILSYLPPLRRKHGPSGAVAMSGRSLARLHEFTLKRGPAIVVVSILIVAVSIAGASRVKAESAFLEMFKESEQVRIDTHKFEEELSGTFTIDVMVDSGRADGIKEPEAIRALDGLESFLQSQSDISSTQSVADYFKDLRRAFFNNDQSQYRLPETREEAAQYLLLYEMDAPDGDIREYVTFDYSQARVTGRVDLNSSAAATRTVNATRQYIAENFPDSLDATVAGVALLYTNMEDYIRESLIRGFSLALIAIFAVLCIQLRSVTLGAIAMIPNLSPIIVCLGVMGFAGIHLDSMTTMVASISIGLAVDDSIHFLSRIRHHIDKGQEINAALHDSTIEIGRALVYTSICLCAGFGVMMAGSFVGMIYFGMLSMLTIAVALIADLLLLPVVLRWTRGAGGTAVVTEPAAGGALAHD